MATHTFVIQTTSLSTKQAAALAYVLSCAAYAVDGASEMACTVPPRVLEREFPGEGWSTCSDRHWQSLVA